jgi:hypothetical protein
LFIGGSRKAQNRVEINLNFNKMKKVKFSPLQMDKKTVAMLDSEQLEKIKGGISNDLDVAPGTTACTRNTCRGGTSSCNGESVESLDF